MELENDKEPSDFELNIIENELFRSQDTNLDDPLRIYLLEIGQVSLLTKDEEIELAQAISNARESIDDKVLKIGKEARDKLILANLRLVVSIAKKYAYSNMELMDLIQDGTMGLMKAADRYQFERGFKFSTYATWWIRQSISRSITNTSRTIRLPAYIHEMLSIVRRIKRNHYDEYGLEPDMETISKMSNIPLSTLKFINLYIFDTISIDQKIGEDNSTMIDLIEDTDFLDPEQNDKIQILDEYVIEMLNMLDERERDIIKMRFGIGTDMKTLNEIGQHFGITRERVRQIEKRAINKLHKLITT